MTCAVWAGFDKPQKIYRGAFGSVIALPVWVDVMNASLTRFEPQPFPVPPGLHKVEICSTSGLLATDKCYEDVRSASGDVVKRRTSYMELATDEQMPTDGCDVHGDTVRTQLVKKFEEGQWPRAALAVDTNEVAPVTMQGPTLLAEDDPYNAIGSTFQAEDDGGGRQTAEPGLDPDKPVKRAIPVAPDAGRHRSKCAAPQPVRPIDDANGETLIQNEPPSRWISVTTQLTTPGADFVSRSSIPGGAIRAQDFSLGSRSPERRASMRRSISTATPPAPAASFSARSQRAIAARRPVLLLLRGDFKETQRALRATAKGEAAGRGFAQGNRSAPDRATTRRSRNERSVSARSSRRRTVASPRRRMRSPSMGAANSSPRPTRSTMRAGIFPGR